MRLFTLLISIWIAVCAVTYKVDREYVPVVAIGLGAFLMAWFVFIIYLHFLLWWKGQDDIDVDHFRRRY
jgi:hypothetical protein